MDYEENVATDENDTAASETEHSTLLEEGVGGGAGRVSGVGAEEKSDGIHEAERSTWEIVQGEWRLFLGLSLVGFLVNCQPSEPYLAKYLMEDKNLSSVAVESHVWPYYTYSFFLWLLPIGFCSDAVGYRPVIFFGLMCRQATRLLLLYAEGLWPMSLMQVTYSGAIAVNTVYFAYAFLAAPPDAAPLALSVMYSMHSLGNVCGSLLGQALVASGVAVRTLFYVSWAFTSAGLLWFLLMFPSPRTKVFPESLFTILRREGVANATVGITDMYGPRLIRVWSLWWVFAYATYSIITNYYENEFYEIDPNGAFGTSESALEAARMVGCLLPALAPNASIRHTFPIIALSALGSALLLYMSTTTHAFFVAVTFNALVLGLFGFAQALSEMSISFSLRRLGSPRYAVVFSCNTFVAAGLAVLILQVLASNEAVTATYYYAACALYGVMGVTVLIWAAMVRCNREL